MPLRVILAASWLPTCSKMIDYGALPRLGCLRGLRGDSTFVVSYLSFRRGVARDYPRPTSSPDAR